MFPLGVQFAASGLVGSSLGKGNSEQAKRYAITCVLLTVTFVTTLSAILILWSEAIALMFTNDVETIQIVVNTLPALSLFIILDAVHGV